MSTSKPSSPTTVATTSFQFPPETDSIQQQSVPLPTTQLSLIPIVDLLNPNHPWPSKLHTLTILFEHSPALSSLLRPYLDNDNNFASLNPTKDTPVSITTYTTLISHIRHLLLTFSKKGSNNGSDNPLIQILSSHPRLGEKPKNLSRLSSLEQQSSNLQKEEEEEKEGKEREREGLKSLNQEYEAKFPGLRYVVFVNARPRSEILRDMRRRIDRGAFEDEVKEGINAMCDIALDRVKKLGYE